jgi:integrase
MSEEHFTSAFGLSKPPSDKPESAPRRKVSRNFQPFNPQEKPAKPTPDFPLFPHATRRWAKKIRGKLHYFGPWEDPQGALARYLEQKDNLHAGRTPRESTEDLTVLYLANHFLTHKQSLMDAGELTNRTFVEYKAAAGQIVTAFGKNRLVDDLRPEDFAALRKRMAASWGPQRLAKIVQYVRSIFKHGTEAGLIERVVRFGPGFDRPSKKVLRLHKAKQGVNLFAAAEVRQLLAAAHPQLKAMIFLGINAGFGNSDCGNLPLTALDLDNGWVDFPRPKTGMARRCPLWPETVAAIREASANRTAPKSNDHAGVAFLTRHGLPWGKVGLDNPISKETAKLIRKLGINGRKGLGFYTLRHTFRTVADDVKDQPAADYLMGHVSSHISATYREKISDARLKAVTDHVRGWLFGTPNV